MYLAPTLLIMCLQFNQLLVYIMLGNAAYIVTILYTWLCTQLYMLVYFPVIVCCSFWFGSNTVNT